VPNVRLSNPVKATLEEYQAIQEGVLDRQVTLSEVVEMLIRNYKNAAAAELDAP
jgi:hypothetical protein